MNEAEDDNQQEPMSAAALKPFREVASPAPVADPKQALVEMSKRVQTVIDAAERAASSIRSDAEEEARRHLEDAQRKADELTAERVALIAELTDDLIRHAGIARDRSQLMVTGLEEAVTSVTDRLRVEGVDARPTPNEQRSADPAASQVPNEPWPSQPPRQVSPRPKPRPTLARFRPRWPFGSAQDAPAAGAEPAAQSGRSRTINDPDPTEVYLQATRLAGAGHDRDAIVAVLERDYGIAETTPIVDRALRIPN